MKVSVLINNFSSGEITPLLAARPDTIPYVSGARRLENFIPLATGGITKRPGTWFDGYTRTQGPGKLICFPLSNGRYVIVEFTAGFARIRNDDFSDPGIVLSVPYDNSALSRIQYSVNKDTLWLVHPRYPVRRIIRNGDAFTTNVPSFTGFTFNAPGDYPSALAFDSGRLFLASTDNHPNGIWGSRPPDSTTGTDRYTDFTITEAATGDEALYLEESDMYGSRIRWLASSRAMLAGTDRATWSDTGEIPTPVTFDMNIIQYGGSSYIQGQVSRDAVLYAGRNGTSLRALAYNPSNQTNGAYVDMNISEAANHLFLAGIRDLCVTDFPFETVWIALNDGSLVSCTLNIGAGTVAYARHPREGAVESLAAGKGESNDVVWMIVNRNGVRAVEHLVVKNTIDSDYEESHFVDSGLRLELPAPSKTIPGLDHLAGRTVTALGDGALLPPREVSAFGTVEYDEPVQMLHIGLPYTSALVPTVPEIPANGTSIGKKRRIDKVLVRMYESFGGKIGVDGEHLETLVYPRFGAYRLGTAPEPFTGDDDVTMAASVDPEGKFLLVHDEPVPFTLLALVEHIALMEV